LASGLLGGDQRRTRAAEEIEDVLSGLRGILQGACGQFHGLLGVVRDPDGGLEGGMPFDTEVPNLACVPYLLDMLDQTQRVFPSLVFQTQRAAAFRYPAHLVEVQVIDASSALEWAATNAAEILRQIVGVEVRPKPH